MSDINTVKAQIQSLIDLANTTTGNTDTNLTDGVNALVGGYGQGGIQLPEDMLEGLENGYDVMFYDENNKGLAFYSVKQGHAIQPPEYQVEVWQTSDGANVTFPYLPTSDVSLYANSGTYADQLYKFYGVDKGAYPYVGLSTYTGGSPATLMFGTGIGDNTTKSLSLSPPILMASVPSYLSIADYTNVQSVVDEVMVKIPKDILQESSSGYGFATGTTVYHYLNFDSNLTKTKGKYRLDE